MPPPPDGEIMLFGEMPDSWLKPLLVGLCVY